MSKIRFRVVNYSSEAPDYPAAELNSHSPNTRGWQSIKFSEYPQEVGMELLGGEFRLSQVQILSHQSKISTKIEIFIGTGSDYHTANYKRLGFLSLDTNERSSFQARELKTVYIDQAGKFIRLIIHQNHINKQNLFNQVGIVAVNLLGNSEDSSISSSSSSQVNRNISNNNEYAPSNNSLNDLSIDMNLDPQTAAKLRLLSDAKSRAIASEDYLTAKKIKSIEGELKSLGARLAQLDVAKRQAVDTEDYDRACDIKKESDEMRGVIEQKILDTHIPGVTDVKPIKESPRYSQSKGYDDNNYNNNRNNNNNGNYSNEKRDQRFAPEEDEQEDMGYGNNISSSRNNNQMNKNIINVDDQVVGPRKTSSSGGSGRKSNNDNDGYQEDEYTKPIKIDYGIASAPEKILPGGDRPIRPKERTTYDDRDPNGPSKDDYEEQHYQNDNEFSPGEHPLEDIPNFEELPNPEELRGKLKDMSDQGGITNLIGEYRARCLFSKTWTLREASMHKINLMLQDFEEEPGIANCLSTFAAIIRVGCEDKIQQVLFNSVQLLEDVLASTRRAKLSQKIVAPLMDPILTNLIEKLADGNARLREGARKGTEIMAASINVGPAVVASHTLRNLHDKQKTAWRPILARLQQLKELVTNYGVAGNTGMMPESLMNFIKTCSAFAHSNGEVRDAARDLTVAIQKYVGTPALESYLTVLRPKQYDEYIAAFEGGGGQKKGAVHKSPAARSKPNNATHSPNGKVNTSASRPGDKLGDKSVDEQQDFTACMFCGAKDGLWNEDALDLHYWKDCPLLAPCPACAQVVEIAGLPEHLLDECEQKESFIPCDKTGLAIRENELDDWKSNPLCVTPPANFMTCPLCKDVIEDSDEEWKKHLVYSCPQNTRTGINP
jgi:centrosomal protein CEP104